METQSDTSYFTANNYEQELYPTRSVVMDFLRECTRLLEVIPDLETLFHTSSVDQLFVLIKGAVQSGKSRLMYAFLLYLTMEEGHNGGVILRNQTGDYDQFDSLGFQPFLEEFCAYAQNTVPGWTKEDADLPLVFYMGNIQKSRQQKTLQNHHDLLDSLDIGRTIVIALGNADHIQKLDIILNEVETDETKRFMLLIDEADQLMYSLGNVFSPRLEILKQKCALVMAVTATVMENLQDPMFTTSRAYIMTPPPGYKGIKDIQFKYLEPIAKKTRPKKNQPPPPPPPPGMDSVFFRRDPSLYRFLLAHKDTPPFSLPEPAADHPVIVLLKTERIIVDQDRMLETIRTHDAFREQYTVLVYNGTCVKLYAHSLNGQVLHFPSCHRTENKMKSSIYEHVFPNCPIQYALQYLKDHGGAAKFPRILIVSHGLVGRGINLVSQDFGWHCTHMYYRPSHKPDVTTLHQSIRLCGVYRDDLPLTCYIEKEHYENIYRGYQLQEDIFQRLRRIETPEHDTLPGWLCHQRFSHRKIPRGRITKREAFMGRVQEEEGEEDGGMSMVEFNQFHCGNHQTVVFASPSADPSSIVPSTEDDTEKEAKAHREEMNRLTHPNTGMFKKWGSLSNENRIARFMRHLDPEKEYTRTEIRTECEVHQIQMGHIYYRPPSKNTTKEKKSLRPNYGRLLQKTSEDRFRLHPDLLQAFHQFF